MPTCRGCQCTDDAACEGGCTWVSERWCSRCDQKVSHYMGHIRDRAREHGLPLITVFVHDGKTCTVASGLLGEMGDVEQARLLIHASYSHLDLASEAEGGLPAYDMPDGGPHG